MDKFLLRVLPPSCGRDVRNRTFQDFQQCLLHTFTRNITGDRRVLTLAGDLVDLVDVDNPFLRTLHIIICRLKQPKKDVFNILADIARFGQSGCIRDGKRNIEHPREGLRQQGFAHACRAEQKDIRLVQLNIPHVPEIDALIVVIDRDRERTLRLVLPDHIFVQFFFNLTRLIYSNLLLLRPLVTAGALRRGIVIQNTLAQLHAFVADADARAGDQTLYLRLHLTAK